MLLEFEKSKTGNRSAIKQVSTDESSLLPQIEFASPEGKKFFVEALAQGTMEGFFKLISYYQTQSEPAYCGLASLAVVLNALAIDLVEHGKVCFPCFPFLFFYNDDF
ncbi:hypothetical protein K1719_008905 [Acacia pycnantha]|nr:hypothetical protein K1719_008905 [Acacia pycnantha]